MGSGLGIGVVTGSALLASWILVRYRHAGPRTIQSSAVVCGVAMLACGSTSAVIPWVIRVADPVVAVLFVAVPIFVFAFWSAGVLMRTFLAALSGR